jgi:bifunctional UDP-N-acetylglucosamine pyrophosphorylase/glucosamine-1-phosphate N-acetyltransferase
MLVAPVKIGARSKTGAGAVVTADVEADTLVVRGSYKTIRKISGGK